MATPNEIMTRVHAMRASRLAMQRAIQEKERLANLTDAEREQERWAKMSPMDRYAYACGKAAEDFPKIMAAAIIAPLIIMGIILWIGG